MSNKANKSFLTDYLLLDKQWHKYLIISALVVLISLLFPQGKSLQYVYQLNDIAYEPVIAPFTFPILKSNQKLQNDLDERKNSIPYVFNRDLNIAEKQKVLLSDFFLKVNELRYANWRLEESKRLGYERRYHKQYEKARMEFASDITNLSIISEKLYE